MPILQLVCCVWVSNCLSPIQSLIVFFWQLWGYANQPAVCLIISLAILWLLAIYETGVLPWHWAYYFWPFILFAFWGFMYAICPPRMPSLRAPCMCDHRGFCTKKGTELALMLTLNALLFLFSGLNFWIKASEFLFYSGFHKLYSLSSLSLVGDGFSRLSLGIIIDCLSSSSHHFPIYFLLLFQLLDRFAAVLWKSYLF